MKVIVSGFEPFGQLTKNPTMDLLYKLHNNEIPGIEVETVLLPVVFKQCADKLLAKMAEIQPDAVIALGLAKGRTEIQFERIAINSEDTGSEGERSDNAGDAPVDRPIIPEGPDGIFSTLPIRTLQEKLREEGIPASISNSAGTYICNTTMYWLMHEVKKKSHPPAAGFIHVPLTPEMTVQTPGLPSMPMELQYQALETILRSLQAMKEFDDL